MAQQIIYESQLQTTVDFSEVGNGHIFIHNNLPCCKINQNNPNYQEIKQDGTGQSGRLQDTDQVVYPPKALVKVE